MVGEELK
jgi:hypothetical protein